MKKFTRILALVLALVLVAGLALTARAAEVQTPNGRSLDENELPPIHLGGERKIVSFEILNADDLPLLVFNRMASSSPTMMYQWWDQVSALQFRVHYDDGATAVKSYAEVGASASHNIVGPDSDENRITITIGDCYVTYTPKFAETDVASIEILEEPILVLGENSNAIKVGEDKGVLNHWDSTYNGLKFRINYTDGTSAVVNHEELDRQHIGEEEDHASFYHIPKYNGYNVNIQMYLEEYGQGDRFTFWTGNRINETGVIPMVMLYKGIMVHFDAHVVEGTETQILYQPSDQTLQYSETAIFAVGVTGAGLQYQWQYRANADAAWADCEDAAAPTLEVVADETVENFQYRCVITDGEGEVFYSDVVTLTVEYPLYIENYDTYHINDLVLGSDGVYKTPDGFDVVIGVDVPLLWNGGRSLKDYVDDYGEDLFDLTHWDKLVMLMDENGFVPLTATTLEYLRTTTTGNPAWGESDDQLGYYLFYGYDNPHAVKKNGWLKEDGQWVYYEDGELVKNRWVEDGDKWCYVGADGYMVKDKWVKDGSYWCYLDKNGYMVTNKWVKDGSNWCYVDQYGRMVTNKWVKDGSEWCYIDKHGNMVTNGWAKDGSKWCYMGADGYMVENKWVKDGSQWCYIGADGYMVTNGWAKDAGKWCYMNAYGYITYSKWVNDGKGWGYVDGNGYMVTNKWQKDGSNWCYIGANGYQVFSKWVKDGSQWCYIGADGNMVTNGWAKDAGKWCYMNAYGYITYNKWVKDGQYWAYVGSDGYMATNKWIDNGNTWSYVDKNGHALTGTHTIDGETYTFDANGEMPK